MQRLHQRSSALTKCFAGLVVSASCLTVPDARALGGLRSFFQPKPVITQVVPEATSFFGNNPDAVVISAILLSVLVYAGYYWWMAEKSGISRFVRIAQQRANALSSQITNTTDGSLLPSEVNRIFTDICGEFDLQVLHTVQAQIVAHFPEKLTSKYYPQIAVLLQVFKNNVLAYRHSLPPRIEHDLAINAVIGNCIGHLSMTLELTQYQMYDLDFLQAILIEYADQLQVLFSLEAQAQAHMEAVRESYLKKGNKDSLTAAEQDIRAELEPQRFGGQGPVNMSLSSLYSGSTSSVSSFSLSSDFSSSVCTSSSSSVSG